LNLFFDLDGTLTNPELGIVTSLKHALATLKIEIDADIDLASYIGPPLRDVLRELCGDAELAERAVSCYRQRYADVGLFENHVYDGIDACLEQLGEFTHALYVVTSKPTVYAERIIDHFGLERHFRAVYGSHLDGRLGDKSELIGHVLATEGIAPADAVMIGDRKFDIVGARNNGIASIGVLWGFGTEQELRAACADSLCAQPEHIVGQLGAAS